MTPNQLGVIVKILVEKALTPAAMPNALLLALLLLKRPGGSF